MIRKESRHIPVLLKESIELLMPEVGGKERLKPQKTKVFMDCTLGDGGHFLEIIKRVPKGSSIIGIDVDDSNFEKIKQKVSTLATTGTTAQKKQFANKKIKLLKSNFNNLGKILEKLNISKVDGILADLGFASPQLEKVPGLSFQRNEKLDMRLDKSNELTAEKILNEYDEKELEKVLKEYGEERKARVIAHEIVKTRRIKPIERTNDLVKIIQDCYSGKERISGINVATKTFMALRIEVNQELDSLEKLLEQAPDLLEKEGRVGIISFHSLEDRLVKSFLKKEAKKCICDEEALRCTCLHQPRLKVITKKPVVPSPEEVKNNPRSRSAKLRIAEKV